MTQATLV